MKYLILILVLFSLLVFSCISLISVCMWGCPNTGVQLVFKLTSLFLACSFVLSIYFYLRKKRCTSARCVSVAESSSKGGEGVIQREGGAVSVLMLLGSLILNPITLLVGFLAFILVDFRALVIVLFSVLYCVGLSVVKVRYVGIIFNFAIFFVALYYAFILPYKYSYDCLAGVYMAFFIFLIFVSLSNVTVLLNAHRGYNEQPR